MACTHKPSPFLRNKMEFSMPNKFTTLVLWACIPLQSSLSYVPGLDCSLTISFCPCCPIPRATAYPSCTHHPSTHHHVWLPLPHAVPPTHMRWSIFSGYQQPWHILLLSIFHMCFCHEVWPNILCHLWTEGPWFPTGTNKSCPSSQLRCFQIGAVKWTESPWGPCGL